MSSNLSQQPQHFVIQEEFKAEDLAPKECRICFQTENQMDILVNPCLCRGTMACVHEQCLIRWLSEKNITRCELCKHEIRIMHVFTVRRLLQLIKQDLEKLFSTRDSASRFGVKVLCMIIYIKHFLPVVRFLRTKMLRNLCTLWMIFEQEEKLRLASPSSFSWQRKLKQILTQEIPITIKLMLFMWFLRKFVGVGCKLLVRACKLVYYRYINAKELRFIRNNIADENVQLQNNQAINNDQLRRSQNYYQMQYQQQQQQLVGLYQIGDSLEIQ